MKPIILHGHTRPIRDIKFNKDGDFLFTASNDRYVTLWASETGERIGTYYHSAAVNNIAISRDSRLLIAGDATGGCYIWEVCTGKLLKKIELESTFSVRSVDLSYGDQKVAFTYGGRAKDAKSYLDVYNIEDILKADTHKENVVKNIKPSKSFTSNNSKYVNCKWMNLNKDILCSREDGVIQLINYESEQVIREKQVHSATVMDMDISLNEEIILTASKDGKSCVLDPFTFDVIHTLHPQDPTRNINSCKISPLFCKTGEEERFHAIIAGGQESRDVTTTHTKKGGFDLLIYNIMYAEELGAIQGHFGPVNTLAFDPYGRIVASGAEDASVRVHKLEEEYFNLG